MRHKQEENNFNKRRQKSNHVTMSRRGLKVKDSDVFKAVKENNRNKFLKLLSSERTTSVTKIGVKEESSIPGGRIRLKLSHINLDCHEEDTGYTPLIIAVLNGYKDIADDLIFHSADVNKRDNKGNSALHMAVFNGKIEMVDLLLQSKVKVNTQNSDGNSPLHIICQADHEHRVHIMLKLLQADAEAKLVNNDMKCPLDVAAMFNKADAVSVLLDHDSSLKENKVAIVEAAIRGHNNIVELLLDYGIDPNGLDDLREMSTAPLIEAVRFHRFDVAETLLKYGAKPDLKNKMAESAESLAKLNLPEAASKKFKAMFEAFKASGATVAPRFLKVLSRGASQLAKKDYPELPNVMEIGRAHV